MNYHIRESVEDGCIQASISEGGGTNGYAAHNLAVEGVFSTHHTDKFPFIAV